MLYAVIYILSVEGGFVPNNNAIAKKWCKQYVFSAFTIRHKLILHLYYFASSSPFLFNDSKISEAATRPDSIAACTVAQVLMLVCSPAKYISFSIGALMSSRAVFDNALLSSSECCHPAPIEGEE